MTRGEANELAGVIREALKEQFVVKTHQLNAHMTMVYQEIKPVYAVGIHIPTGMDSQNNVLSICISSFSSWDQWVGWKKAAIAFNEKIQEDRLSEQLEEEANKDVTQEKYIYELPPQYGPFEANH